ncbi:hypothetical protein PAXRUDRAFT_824281 [Paxillus rubicundulus Ve08.2h10]|uniref:Uncharacterized protein n=1 Tax=Paxillus rubicundulus Ve08.2h10 TaxID=930991 RepID=A0A0D0E298_9AGAM|nr:hypothetical protein PAXRUDRAFT_824281 [Paxillus rubicundulus Ve08.2h10]
MSDALIRLLELGTIRFSARIVVPSWGKGSSTRGKIPKPDVAVTFQGSVALL